ncbi:hypothetical protein ACEWY4_013947 [Coilia grayii]|uniref:HAT C-terminal dimerisation domain-containing protein n=1 Tax=Coilia grayii TaxID=363190 RepID=A0ABD1JXU0_9TELE
MSLCVLEKCDADSELTTNLKLAILEQIGHRYDDTIQRILRKATLLDPRYRGGHMIPPVLRSTRCDLMEEIVENMPASSATPSPSHSEGDTGESAATVPKHKKASLGSLLGKRVARESTLTDDQKAEAEMAIYLQERVIDREENPLIWWKNNQCRFPLMAKLAKKYLCICATSTPSERVFSTAGSVVTPIRSLLKPEKENMFVFLARNIEI